jgi:AcrR family transcriptional regulator
MPPRAAPLADQRARLLDVALRRLEEAGPEALQTRSLTAEVGASTQAVYTLFGGMPGLFEALVAEGFVRFARHVRAVPESDDPVADFFAQGAAFCDWAFAHPQLYRLMFGLTGGRLRLHAGLEVAMTSTLERFTEGREALAVMVGSIERVKEAGRIDPVDSVVAAGQFLSATHGYVLLTLGGAFGDPALGLLVIGSAGVNLMVGLGDDRAAAEQSLLAAAARRGDELSA